MYRTKYVTKPRSRISHRGIKKLKIKVRKACIKRKLGTLHMDKFKQLSLNLLSAKKQTQETYLKSILSIEGKSWAEFYKYVKRRRENRESVPAIKDGNGQNITDPAGKANLLNSYFSTIFSIKDNMPILGGLNTIKPFTNIIRTIRRRTKKIGKHKSVGPDGIPGDILRMGGEAMIPYLARLLEVTINNGILPED